MKHTHRSFLVAILVLLYGLGLGQLQESLGSPFEYLSIDTGTAAAHHIAAPTFGDVYALPLGDGAEAGLQHGPYQTVKDTKHTVPALAPFEATVSHTFKHLTRTTLQLLLRERLVQLLFPTHFFW